MQQQQQHEILPDRWISEKEAARLLSLSQAWLASARGNGTGPKYARLSSTTIRYLTSDVIEFMRERTHGGS